MRPLSTHPLLCVYAKCGDILHTTSFNTLMGLSCYVVWYRVILQGCTVSMPSWAWVVTLIRKSTPNSRRSFNALSGLYLISTIYSFSLSGTTALSVNALSGLYLISTKFMWYGTSRSSKGVNALSGLYLISTVPLQKPRFYAVSRACFCRYLSEYSYSSCFSCMLTFWTYLMRCTYPRHWIKYSTNYNRCHPIFFTLLISWAEQ